MAAVNVTTASAWAIQELATHQFQGGQIMIRANHQAFAVLVLAGCMGLIGCSRHGSAAPGAETTFTMAGPSIYGLDRHGHVWGGFARFSYTKDADKVEPGARFRVLGAGGKTEKRVKSLVNGSYSLITSDNHALTMAVGENLSKNEIDEQHVSVLFPQVAKFVKGKSFTAALLKNGRVLIIKVGQPFLNDFIFPGSETGKIADSDLAASLAAGQALDAVKNIYALEGGSDRLLILRNDGTVWEFMTAFLGDNSVGILTIGPTLMNARKIAGIDNVVEVSTWVGPGGVSGTALKSDGSVVSWDAYPRVGENFSEDNILAPKVRVLPAFGKAGVQVVQVAAGPMSGGAIDSDGHVWVWGHGPGEAGKLKLFVRGRRLPAVAPSERDAATADQPMKIAGIENAVDLQINDSAAAVLCKDGTVWAWSDDDAPRIVLKNIKVP